MPLRISFVIIENIKHQSVQNKIIWMHHMQLMYIVPIGKISQQNKKKYFPSYIGPELKQKKYIYCTHHTAYKS